MFYIHYTLFSYLSLMYVIELTLRINLLLHNEYRRSFEEASRKFCDVLNKEPFVGGAIKNAGLVCPLPVGHHALTNITAPTENFPNVFPFEKGRTEIVLSITDTKEPILQIFIVASFKQNS